MVEEIPKKRSKEAVEEDVQRLKEWLYKQPHLPHDVENTLLSAFVNGTKTLEAAKRKLDGYYSSRNKAVKFYDENARNINAQFKEKSKASKQFFLSNPTPEGYIVFYNIINDCFTKAFDHQQDLCRQLMMMELSMMKWPESNGMYLVMDCAGIPSNSPVMFSLPSLATALSCFQDGYPIKLKGIFLINSHPIIEFVMNNVIRPVMKAKLFNRIKVVGEGESYLSQYMPLELLPSDVGGNDKSSVELNEQWMSILEENREWFLLSTKVSSDEKKRPPDSQNTYGIEGTFRKLAVD